MYGTPTVELMELLVEDLAPAACRAAGVEPGVMWPPQWSQGKVPDQVVMNLASMVERLRTRAAVLAQDGDEAGAARAQDALSACQGAWTAALRWDSTVPSFLKTTEVRAHTKYACQVLEALCDEPAWQLRTRLVMAGVRRADLDAVVAATLA